jgi:hypothetical protein
MGIFDRGIDAYLLCCMNGFPPYAYPVAMLPSGHRRIIATGRTLDGVFMDVRVKGPRQPDGPTWQSHRLREFAHKHNLICYWCGDEVDLQVRSNHPLSATREHLTPKSLLGKRSNAKYVLAHQRCNNMRACMSADGFLRLMAGEAVTKSDLWPHEFEFAGQGA